MANAGILMHIRHLNAVGWEKLVWGVPEEDSLGSLPKIVELLLQESDCEPITTIIFGCGPSSRDGLSEGEYTKQYLLQRLADLREFPRFAERLDDTTLQNLHTRLEAVIVTKKIARSIDEITLASRIFTEREVTKVLQVTAASHAPRCIQIQSAARAAKLIPVSQTWFLVADDRSYEGADPFSTVIFEPAHRGDDAMLDVTPSMPDVLRSYHYVLSVDRKKALIAIVDAYMKEHAEDSDVRS